MNIKKYFEDLKTEFEGYNASGFAKDIMAGLTVAAVALPLAIAFGVGSGATAASGLLTAIISGFVISLLGGAFYQISGPTGAMAAILMSIIAHYGMSGVFTATVMAGIALVLAGVFHMGGLTAYIPMPVIAGFTSGIAVIIAMGQLDNFFGVTSEGDSAVEKFFSYFSGDFDPNMTAIAVGIAVIIFMVIYPKKWNNVIPSSLIAIILATAAEIALGLEINTVGKIPSSLILDERFTLASIDLQTIRSLISPAISIAALGMVESLLCGASAGRMTGVTLDNDRELIAQGIGNIISPLFGGIPATAAIARTSVAVKSGAKTRIAGMFHAVVLLISMLILGPVMSRIPLAALAGVLMVTAWRMNEWETIHYILERKFRGAALKFAATMIATIVFDLTTAIFIGVIIALVLLVQRQSHLEINFDDIDRRRLHDQKMELDEIYEEAEVVYITGAIIFANTKSITDLAERFADKSAVIFSMRGTSYMDISGAQAFLELINDVKEKSIPVYICGVPDSVRDMMEKSGIVDCVGENNFYWSVENALAEAN